MAEETLTADELAELDEAIGFGLEGLGTPSRSYTYSRVTARTTNVTAGTAGETAGSGTVTMFPINHTASQGIDGPEGGMRSFMVRQSHIAAQVSGFSEPSRLDHFTDGTYTFMVRNWSKDPLSRFWFIKCEMAVVP